MELLPSPAVVDILEWTFLLIRFVKFNVLGLIIDAYRLELTKQHLD